MTKWTSELLCTAFTKEQFPAAAMREIVFMGRSNVGKSTLINALLGKKIAKVSSTPGKTRSVNFYGVNTGDGSFALVDIPGYGYAARGAEERRSWRRLIENYFKSGRQIVFAVHLVDFRHGFLANDEDLTAWLDGMDMPRLVVFTKGDKISRGKQKTQYNAIVSRGVNSVLPPFVVRGASDAAMEEVRAGMENILDELAKRDKFDDK